MSIFFIYIFYCGLPKIQYLILILFIGLVSKIAVNKLN